MSFNQNRALETYADPEEELTSPWVVTPRARILVADDDPSSLLALTTEFRRQGYDVYPAGSGDEALALLAEMHANGAPTDDVELIVLENAMEERSGVQILRDARRQRYTMPVLLIADAPAAGLCTLAACLDAVVLLRPLARQGLGEVAIRLILQGQTTKRMER